MARELSFIFLSYGQIERSLLFVDNQLMIYDPLTRSLSDFDENFSDSSLEKLINLANESLSETGACLFVLLFLVVHLEV